MNAYVFAKDFYRNGMLVGISLIIQYHKLCMQDFAKKSYSSVIGEKKNR